MRIGVDLLWVRPGKNGGTESFIRNILDGFQEYCKDQTIVLFVSEDNKDSFAKYRNSQFETIICPVKTSSFIRRVIWENMRLPGYSKMYKIDGWFFPVYSRPFFMGKVPTITVIHDLQALHYPEYFSKLRNAYFRYAWKNDCKKSTKIITISNFCKNDILSNYHIDPSKIEVIYNPIQEKSSDLNFDYVASKYDIKKNDYYYAVSSLAKHKNLITLLKAIRELRNRGNNPKLVISGVKVNAEDEIMNFIQMNYLEDSVIYTGFVSDDERDALYKYCKQFLFPSVFEGFGMPPVEAMLKGVAVITTKETSVFEVTEGLANYVMNPFDENEWADRMTSECKCLDETEKKRISEKYSLKRITDQYIKTIINVIENATDINL